MFMRFSGLNFQQSVAIISKVWLVETAVDFGFAKVLFLIEYQNLYSRKDKIN
jgi:hypothetical protein